MRQGNKGLTLAFIGHYLKPPICAWHTLPSSPTSGRTSKVNYSAFWRLATFLRHGAMSYRDATPSHKDTNSAVEGGIGVLTPSHFTILLSVAFLVLLGPSIVQRMNAASPEQRPAPLFFTTASWMQPWTPCLNARQPA